MRIQGNRMEWPGGALTCLNDGAQHFGQDFFPDPRGAVLPDVITLPVHAFVLQRQGADPVLIDTGQGEPHGVASALDRVGIGRDKIGTVVFTHLHGDHRGGYLAGGYETAQVYVSAAEADFWSGQNHPAHEVLNRAGPLLQLCRDGDEIVAGLRVWHLPGHTPGHIGLILEDRIAIVGDLLHRADLQLGDPDLATRYDIAPSIAAATRKTALARIDQQGLVMCGGHIRVPGHEASQEGAPFLRISRAGHGWQAKSA
jgi:glyoxylase-like metal-dependent hydrolase (beta-lactamase superfamily II)